MILKSIESFLKQHIQQGQTYLLGYSGGVDSNALLHALLYYKDKISFHLEVVHVDHQWRASSTKEAHVLKEYVENLRLVFHLETIPKDLKNTGNIEESYRKERLKIFSRLSEKLEAKGIFLGHHRDDQAETVFKRIFEGASLSKIRGLTPIVSNENLVLIRPLLNYSKKQLHLFAQKHPCPFIHDETNEDEHYLRARQRKTIFPMIEGFFGKGSVHNLCRLSESLESYKSYMDEQIRPYKETLKESSLGVKLDLESCKGIKDYELAYLIRSLFERYKVSAPSSYIEDILQHLKQGSSNIEFRVGDFHVYIDRMRAFFVPFSIPSFDEEINVDKIPFTFENKSICWTLEEGSFDSQSSQDLWEGESLFVVKNKPFTLKKALLPEKVAGRTLRRAYLEEKVPAFLKDKFPGVYEQGVLCHHPLIKRKVLDQEGVVVKLRLEVRESIKVE